MYGQTSLGCDATPSARERYHAAIVYGSADPAGLQSTSTGLPLGAAAAALRLRPVPRRRVIGDTARPS
jgi:hypothetical protein